MRARDLAEDFPVVTTTTDAAEATRLLVERSLPGLVVLDDAGHPLVVLPGSQLVRALLPDWLDDDLLAAVYTERDADRLCRALPGRTVGEVLAGEVRPRREGDRPVVAPDATLVQVATVMSRQRSPMVAVVDDGAVVGVITVHRLLGAMVGPR